MGEPKGDAGSEADSEGSAVPEGAAGGAADSAQRLGVPLFPSGAKPAGSLDLLVELDEPELLVSELKKRAREHPESDKRWLGILRLCERAQEYFEHISRPKPNRPQP